MTIQGFDFKTMRKYLAEFGIAAPESDEELGLRWGIYVKMLSRIMSKDLCDEK